MHLRLFRLIERHQRIDEHLRFAQQRADSQEVARLRSLKLKAKQLIHRFHTRRALLSAQARLAGAEKSPT
jgi:uncharacterized protein YdcH (DUF465 family)